MFGKLKEKLKNSLSIFSKKAEEEVKEEEVVEEAKEEVTETVEETKEVIGEKEEPTPEVVEEPAEKEVVEEKPEEPQIVEEEAKEPIESEEQPSAEELIEESKEEVEETVEKKVDEDKTEEPQIVDEEVKEPIEKIIPEDKEFIEKVEKIVEGVKLGKPAVEEQKEEPKVEVPKVEIIEDEPKKKGFFGKLFSKKEKVKETKEEVKEPLVEKKTEEKKETPIETKEKVTEETPEEKKSLFSKIKQSVTTKTISAEKFEKLFWDLEIVLLESNVSVEVIEKIKEDLKEELVDKPLPRDIPKKIEQTLKQSLDNILTFEKVSLLQEKKPLVIALFGINGSGKTTSVAKLTKYFQNNNKSVVLAACDTFRAAAIQQLEEHADKLNVKMIKHDYGSDAAAVAYDAIKYAEKNEVDVVLIDTAGRLHSNTNLMAELEKIIRVTKPDFKIFIGESITGNDCIEQAKRFNELTEIDGAILTKADVDEKGGAPLSIAYTIKKPILFLGMGQNYEDLEEFDKEKILDRLFG